MYKSVPDVVKVAFGKFYLFSLIYIVFFLIVYPFFLIDTINEFFSGLIFGFLTIFYIYMIRDTRKRVKNYSSTFYYLLLAIVFISISFSVVKFFLAWILMYFLYNTCYNWLVIKRGGALWEL